MSDEFYRQRAARRGRIILIIAGVSLVIVCGIFGVVRAFQDSCTGSFDRSPQAIIESYVMAVVDGNSSTIANCWHHDQYYDPETGCSEVCISKLIGTQINIREIIFSEPQQTAEGRTHMEVDVIILCQENGQEHTAEITLDTVEQNYPWRHWHIIYSTLGGSVPQLWCQ